MNEKLTNKKLKQYYKSVSKELVCDLKTKRRIVRAIKNSASCFIMDNPRASINEIIEHFGTAQEVAEEYCDNESATTINSKVKRTKYIVISVVVAIIIALSIYVITVAIMLVADIKGSNGYGVEYIQTVSTSDTINSEE